MRWLEVFFCIILFVFGVWVGAFHNPREVVIVERKVPFWECDFKGDMEKAEMALNLWGKEICDKGKMVQEKEQMQATLERERKQIDQVKQMLKYEQIDMKYLQHQYWQQGYIEGFKEAMKAKAK